jgi:hypothetical protein
VLTVCPFICLLSISLSFHLSVCPCPSVFLSIPIIITHPLSVFLSPSFSSSLPLSLFLQVLGFRWELSQASPALPQSAVGLLISVCPLPDLFFPGAVGGLARERLTVRLTSSRRQRPADTAGEAALPSCHPRNFSSQRQGCWRGLVG